MAEVVANNMTMFQSDFEKYDKAYVLREGVNAFPFLWMVAPTHTYLIELADFQNLYFSNESLRYAMANGSSWMHAYLRERIGEPEEKIFYVTSDGLQEKDINQAREIVRDVVKPVIVKWEREHGAVPTKQKVAVKLENISIEQLKELVLECRAHGNNSLLSCLKRFHDYRQVAKDHKIVVRWSNYDKCFYFTEFINGQSSLCGAIVFHSWPESGYQENGSVMLNPSFGWSTHT